MTLQFPEKPLYPHELIPYWATVDGERQAVIGADYVITYAQLNGLVTDVAKILAAQGVTSGVQVALLLPNSIEFIVWLFAVIQLGGVAATLDPALKANEASEMIAAGEIDFAVISADKVLGSPDVWIQLCRHVTANTSTVELLRRATPVIKTVQLSHDHNLHRFSSGSTGKPKHVIHTAGNIADDYSHLCASINLNGQDVFLGVTPFFHAFGGLGLFAALSVGAAVIPVHRFMPADIIKIFTTLKPTVFFATPPMLELLSKCFVSEHDKSHIVSLEKCICATGKVTALMRKGFSDRFKVPVFVLYGSSEILSATIFVDDEFVDGCVGKPMPGVDIRIFDDKLIPARPGETGKVGVKSPACIDRYYYGDQLLVIADGYVLPGDKGFLDAQGYLHIKGRDDLINIGGYKVDRHEVEAVISSLFNPGFVLVREYSRAGQPSLSAIIESDDPELTPALVISACKDRLVAYKVPSRVDIVRNLPRDSNGKVRLASLDICGDK